MGCRGFDRLAWAYDALADLVFGSSILKAQQAFLTCIPEGAGILVLGGGTGRFLTVLLQMKPGIHVVFVDSSSQMIMRAKTRVKTSQNVQFILGTHEDLPKTTYDVVVTFFFLDVFKEPELHQVIGIVGNQVKPDGMWLASDFLSEKTWHKAMLRVMYGFFRVVVNLKTSVLPDWRTSLLQAGWKASETQTYYGGFIEASIWKRGT